MRLRFLAILLIPLLQASQAFAQTSNDPVLANKRSILLSRRAQFQKEIQSSTQRLHQVDRDRSDKLEELEQLYAASRAVNPRTSFSKDIADEMAARSRDLRTIERKRSDCLEELDSLYVGLSRLLGDIADCDKALR